MADELNPLDALTSSTEATEGTAPAGQGQPTADTQPSAVQPEGQGQQDATEAGLYDLSSITDPAIRSEVERIAKDIDRNVNAKLQEAATHRKTWEPFEQLGLHEADPDGVKFLLDLAQDLAGDNPREALLNLAEALEIDLGSTPDPAAAGGDDAPLTRAEFQAWKQAQDEERQYAVAYQESVDALQAEYAAIEKAHGQPFDDTPGPNGEPSEKQRLIDLAKRFQPDHDEPIKAAYQLITSVMGAAEKGLVEGQPRQPAPAEPAGRASTAVQPVDTFEEAERIMRERRSAVHS